MSKEIKPCPKCPICNGILLCEVVNEEPFIFGATCEPCSEKDIHFSIWGNDEADIEAKLLENRRASGWLRIVDAPKDGTAILALLPLSSVPSAIRWDAAEGMDYQPCWRICWDGTILGKWDQPTLFMEIHLPDAPEGGVTG